MSRVTVWCLSLCALIIDCCPKSQETAGHIHGAAGVLIKMNMDNISKHLQPLHEGSNTQFGLCVGTNSIRAPLRCSRDISQILMLLNGQTVLLDFNMVHYYSGEMYSNQSSFLHRFTSQTTKYVSGDPALRVLVFFNITFALSSRISY